MTSSSYSLGKTKNLYEKTPQQVNLTFTPENLGILPVIKASLSFLKFVGHSSKKIFPNFATYTSNSFKLYPRIVRWRYIPWPIVLRGSIQLFTMMKTQHQSQKHSYISCFCCNYFLLDLVFPSFLTLRLDLKLCLNP